MSLIEKTYNELLPALKSMLELIIVKKEDLDQVNEYIKIICENGTTASLMKAKVNIDYITPLYFEILVRFYEYHEYSSEDEPEVRDKLNLIKQLFVWAKNAKSLIDNISIHISEIINYTNAPFVLIYNYTLLLYDLLNRYEKIIFTGNSDIKLYNNLYALGRFMDFLLNCGDLHCQVIILKLIIFLCEDPKNAKFVEAILPGETKLQVSFKNINIKCLEYDARNFLNEVNERNLEIKSIYAGKVFFEANQLMANEDQKIWIDYNKTSKRISIACPANALNFESSEEGAGGDIVYIFLPKSIITDINVHKTDDIYELHISFNTALEITREELAKYIEKVEKVIVHLPKNEYSNAFIQSILPISSSEIIEKSFIGKFNANAYRAVASDLSSDKKAKSLTTIQSYESALKSPQDATVPEEEEIVKSFTHKISMKSFSDSDSNSVEKSDEYEISKIVNMIDSSLSDSSTEVLDSPNYESNALKNKCIDDDSSPVIGGRNKSQKDDLNKMKVIPKEEVEDSEPFETCGSKPTSAIAQIPAISSESVSSNTALVRNSNDILLDTLKHSQTSSLSYINKTNFVDANYDELGMVSDFLLDKDGTPLSKKKLSDDSNFKNIVSPIVESPNFSFKYMEKVVPIKKKTVKDKVTTKKEEIISKMKKIPKQKPINIITLNEEETVETENENALRCPQFVDELQAEFIKPISRNKRTVKQKPASVDKSKMFEEKNETDILESLSTFVGNKREGKTNKDIPKIRKNTKQGASQKAVVVEENQMISPREKFKENLSNETEVLSTFFDNNNKAISKKTRKSKQEAFPENSQNICRTEVDDKTLKEVHDNVVEQASPTLAGNKRRADSNVISRMMKVPKKQEAVNKIMLGKAPEEITNNNLERNELKKQPRVYKENLGEESDNIIDATPIAKKRTSRKKVAAIQKETITNIPLLQSQSDDDINVIEETPPLRMSLRTRKAKLEINLNATPKSKIDSWASNTKYKAKSIQNEKKSIHENEKITISQKSQSKIDTNDNTDLSPVIDGLHKIKRDIKPVSNTNDSIVILKDNKINRNEKSNEMEPQKIISQKSRKADKLKSKQQLNVDEIESEELELKEENAFDNLKLSNKTNSQKQEKKLFQQNIQEYKLKSKQQLSVDEIESDNTEKIELEEEFFEDLKLLNKTNDQKQEKKLSQQNIQADKLKSKQQLSVDEVESDNTEKIELEEEFFDHLKLLNKTNSQKQEKKLTQQKIKTEQLKSKKQLNIEEAKLDSNKGFGLEQEDAFAKLKSLNVENQSEDENTAKQITKSKKLKSKEQLNITGNTFDNIEELNLEEVSVFDKLKLSLEAKIQNKKQENNEWKELAQENIKIPKLKSQEKLNMKTNKLDSDEESELEGERVLSIQKQKRKKNISKENIKTKKLNTKKQLNISSRNDSEESEFEEKDAFDKPKSLNTKNQKQRKNIAEQDKKTRKLKSKKLNTRVNIEEQESEFDKLKSLIIPQEIQNTVEEADNLDISDNDEHFLSEFVHSNENDDSESDVALSLCNYSEVISSKQKEGMPQLLSQSEPNLQLPKKPKKRRLYTENDWLGEEEKRETVKKIKSNQDLNASSNKLNIKKELNRIIDWLGVEEKRESVKKVKSNQDLDALSNKVDTKKKLNKINVLENIVLPSTSKDISTSVPMKENIVLPSTSKDISMSVPMKDSDNSTHNRISTESNNINRIDVNRDNRSLNQLPCQENNNLDLSRGCDNEKNRQSNDIDDIVRSSQNSYTKQVKKNNNWRRISTDEEDEEENNVIIYTDYGKHDDKPKVLQKDNNDTESEMDSNDKEVNSYLKATKNKKGSKPSKMQKKSAKPKVTSKRDPIGKAKHKKETRRRRYRSLIDAPKLTLSQKEPKTHHRKSHRNSDSSERRFYEMVYDFCEHMERNISKMKKFTLKYYSHTKI